MANWSDILLTTAQVAVAFAGFTGLIGLFITRDRRGVAPGTMLRFRTMLDYSLIALVGALFPFLPGALQLSDSLVWRASSIAMLLVLVGYWLFIGGVLLRSSITRGERKLPQVVIIGGDIAAAVVLLENAAGVLHPPAFFAYLVVVFWQLAGAVFGFAGVVSLAWIAEAE